MICTENEYTIKFLTQKDIHVFVEQLKKYYNYDDDKILNLFPKIPFVILPQQLSELTITSFDTIFISKHTDNFSEHYDLEHYLDNYKLPTMKDIYESKYNISLRNKNMAGQILLSKIYLGDKQKIITEQIISHFRNTYILLKELIYVTDVSQYIFTKLFETIYK